MFKKIFDLILEPPVYSLLLLTLGYGVLFGWFRKRKPSFFESVRRLRAKKAVYQSDTLAADTFITLCKGKIIEKVSPEKTELRYHGVVIQFRDGSEVLIRGNDYGQIEVHAMRH